jgi:hypothetical protein
MKTSAFPVIQARMLTYQSPKSAGTSNDKNAYPVIVRKSEDDKWE